MTSTTRSAQGSYLDLHKAREMQSLLAQGDEQVVAKKFGSAALASEEMQLTKQQQRHRAEELKQRRRQAAEDEEHAQQAAERAERSSRETRRGSKRSKQSTLDAEGVGGAADATRAGTQAQVRAADSARRQDGETTSRGQRTSPADKLAQQRDRLQQLRERIERERPAQSHAGLSR